MQAGIVMTKQDHGSAATEATIKVRAAVNKWLMNNFSGHRKHLRHSPPIYAKDSNLWRVEILTKGINGHPVHLGDIGVDGNGLVMETTEPDEILKTIDKLLNESSASTEHGKCISGRNYRFSNEDGIAAVGRMDSAIDLLLTDPPYGISKAYNCETQIPRRLRANGRDFIMPKGHFGKWDESIDPGEWLEAVLPKISGWFVSFCAHTQIGEYQRELERHRFSAIGTMVWCKTNPVPFNMRHKPVNAWEAVVVGKRSGAKFNGDGVVHNVFTCKSPSPQKRIHPTQKPLELMSRFVGLFSQRGDVVFDPFAGSGTTVIAAAQNDRMGIGCEASEQQYQASCSRIIGMLDKR